MKVLSATHGGACYGVKRALTMAEEAAVPDRKTFTLGPLIHNPGVVSELEASGVYMIGEDETPSSGTVILRSHGVTPECRNRLEEAGLAIVDATCPHVARAQKAAARLAKEGCHVIVVGEAGHPEVEGLLAYAAGAGGMVSVVSSPEELPSVLKEPVGVVVQTTQKKAVLDAVVNALETRDIKPKVKNTICSATRLRQEEAATLAQSADAMVVIGGRNSSNTTRLAEICKAQCEKTFHIESVEELDEDWFLGCKVVGVTAGASTPESQIEAVLRCLEMWD